MRRRTRWLRVTAGFGVLLGAAVPGAVSGDPGPAALPPQLVLEVQVAGVGAVPVDASAAILNLTVTNPAAAGFATVFPCTDHAPDTSNLNFRTATDGANTVIAPLSADGKACVVTSATTDLIVDVFGYVPAGSDIDVLEVPRRGLDTRSGLGVAEAGPLEPGETIAFDVSAVPGVGDAGAVALNVTSVGAAAPGFMTVAPCDVPKPETSTLNHVAGRDVANLAVTAVAADGTVCIWTNVRTDVVIDVAARIAAGATDPVLLASARRAVDSRLGIGTDPTPWSAGQTRPVDVAEPGVPPAARTAFVNVTATRATAAGFVSLHPCGAAAGASNLNFTPAVDVANAAFVPLGPGQSFCVTASAPVDLIVDVVGAATDVGTIVTFEGVRLYDSRAEAREGCRLGVAFPAPDTLWVVDLDTGSLVAAITDDELVSWRFIRSRWLPALVAPSCDELIVTAAKDANQDRARVLRVGLDGTIVEVAEIAARFPSLPPFIQVRADGTPVKVDNHDSGAPAPPEILPLTGGPPLFTGDTDDRIIQVLDGDVVALLRLDGLGGQNWALFPIAGGGPSDTGPVQGLTLSPGGTYQLVQPISDDVVTVTTLDGATVVSRDLAPLTASRSLWSGVWIDDGLVVLCALSTEGGPVRNFVWNIFSAPVEIPVAACIFGGR